MACEHALFIEPVAPVIYANKHPHRELFSVLVAALCLIAIIGFIAQINTFIYELKTKVDGLKDDNLRLANKLEALAISELNTEVAELKDDNLRIANKLEALAISELKTLVDGLNNDNQRLANKLEFKLEALAISELKMEVAELKMEVAELKTEFATHHHISHHHQGVRNTSLPRSPQQIGDEEVMGSVW